MAQCADVTMVWEFVRQTLWNCINNTENEGQNAPRWEHWAPHHITHITQWAFNHDHPLPTPRYGTTDKQWQKYFISPLETERKKNREYKAWEEHKTKKRKMLFWLKQHKMLEGRLKRPGLKNMEYSDDGSESLMDVPTVMVREMHWTAIFSHTEHHTSLRL